MPFFTWSLLIVMLLLTGCDQPAEPPSVPASGQAATVTIGYSAPEWGGAQYQIMNGLRRRAEQRGWRLLVVNANFDPARQSRQIEYLIRSGVRAIVAVPLDSYAIAESARAAREAGVLFYTIDRAPSVGKVNMVVQADNTLAGRQVAEELAALLQHRHGRVQGTILHLRGDLAQTVARERDAGFREVMEKFPEVRLIDRDTHWQATLFAKYAHEVLASTDIDAIYLQSDMIGVPEVLPVLRKLGKLYPRGHPKHIFVVGVDGGPPALDAIRNGWVDAVASQPLTDFGIIADFIALELSGRPIQPTSPEERLPSDHNLHVVPGPNGPLLQMHTTLVTVANVNSEELWGNRVTLEEAPPDHD